MHLTHQAVAPPAGHRRGPQCRRSVRGSCWVWWSWSSCCPWWATLPLPSALTAEVYGLKHLGMLNGVIFTGR